MKQLMLAAMQSGSGKTIFTCGLLAAFQSRGLRLRAYKCGPDYLDPMLHSGMLGIPSRNLDLFLQGEAGVRRTLGLGAAEGAELALLESAMGYYDGIGATDASSAWHVATAVQAPVVLVLRPKGSSLTLAAQVQGLLAFRTPSRICGLLLNDCKAPLFDFLAPLLERETGLPVLGYLPPMKEAELGSRHLGLLTAGEIADISSRFCAIGRQMEKSVDLERLLHLAAAVPFSAQPVSASKPVCKIAVAQDEAFCFYYADSLDALRACGAELVFFSPLHDKVLPDGVGGLYLGGGYPELYAGALSGNASMLRNIFASVKDGLPTVAECGGFLYLQKSLQDTTGAAWPMAGVLEGHGVKTEQLQRFGYLTLAASQDSMLLRQGERLPAHEFHYWDSTGNGSFFEARKASGTKEWQCGYAGPSLYAAFPHLHFGGTLPLAKRFTAAAVIYQSERRRRSAKAFV